MEIIESLMDVSYFPVKKQIKQNGLRLFFWYDLILHGNNYTILAIAKNISDAKRIAIKKAPMNIQKELKRYLNQPDSIVMKFNHPNSFIYKS